VADDEWAFVAPSLTLMTPAAPQRVHDLGAVFNGLRWVVRTGAPWRYRPNDLPPWAAVDQQTQRWLAAACFAAIVHDLRMLLGIAAGRAAQPTAALLDSRTLQAPPASGGRAGYAGAQRKQGSQIHVAVDTRGHLLAAPATAATEQDRAQVARLAAAVQEVTGNHVDRGYVDQGYTGETPAADAQAHGSRLEVVQHPEARRGFVRLPRRWVVERSCAGTGRFRRRARDYERVAATLVGFDCVAFACLLLGRVAALLAEVHNTL